MFPPTKYHEGTILTIYMTIGVGRGGGGGSGAPQLFEREANIPFAPPPPIIHPHFPSISNKCTRLKGKIIINVALI